MDIDHTAGVRVLKRVGDQVIEDLTNLGRIADHHLMGDIKVEVDLLALLLGVDLEIKCSGSLRSPCCRAVRSAHDVKLYEQSLPPGQGLVLGLSCLGTGLKVPCTKAKGALEQG